MPEECSQKLCVRQRRRLGRPDYSRLEMRFGSRLASCITSLAAVNVHAWLVGYTGRRLRARISIQLQ